MVSLSEVLADLHAESEALDRLVCDLPELDWSRATPAAGWTIAHQIAHLAWTDQICALAASDPAEYLRQLSAIAYDPTDLADRTAAEGIAPPPELLARWRDGRQRLAKALTAMAPDTKLPWFGRMMSPTSAATARLMETWAHGQDPAPRPAGIGSRPRGCGTSRTLDTGPYRSASPLTGGRSRPSLSGSSFPRRMAHRGRSARMERQTASAGRHWTSACW